MKRKRKATQGRSDEATKGKTPAAAPAALDAAAAEAKAERQTQLDYAAGLRMANKGACTASIARAAGSKAKSRRGLSAVGRDILNRLAERGQIHERFNRLHYTLEDFCQGVIDQATTATRVSRTYFMGSMVNEVEDI